VSAEGEPVVDDSFYIIFTAHHEPLDYTLPPARYGKEWKKVMDTFDGKWEDSSVFKPGANIKVEARSVILLLNPKA